MAFWENYHQPASVGDALDQLRRYAGAARVVAGGTDLLLDLQQGRHPPVAALVDVTRIPEMTTVDVVDGLIYIGAAVTHTAIVASPLLAQHATCLVESCGVIGGPQVRNAATLGGNVAHALPAGDGTLALVALEAEAQIATMPQPPASGPQLEWRPIGSLYQGPGKSAVDPTRELIVRFRLRPCGPGEASAFKRVMRPQGVALPILGLAAWVRVAEGVVDEVRLALGPAGPTPLRAARAEAYLTGLPLAPEVLPQLADLVLQDARLRTSPHRATAEYRRELILPLLQRALTLAVRRAVAGQAAPESAEEG